MSVHRLFKAGKKPLLQASSLIIDDEWLAMLEKDMMEAPSALRLRVV